MIALWVVLGAGTALAEAGKDLIQKRQSGTIPPLVLAAAVPVFALPFLIPLAARDLQMRDPTTFSVALIADAVLHAVAGLLYASALKISDLSMAVPMIAFTPLFMLVTSPIIIGEMPSLYGAFGVALIVAGSYVLSMSNSECGFLAPFRCLLRDKGSVSMLTVAAIWSVTGTIDRIGINASTPWLWIASLFTLMALIMIACCVYYRLFTGISAGAFLWLIPIGALNALSTWCYIRGILLTNIAYLVAVKRTSVLLSVMIGGLLLKEDGLSWRLAGSAVMFAGICVFMFTK